MRVLVTGSTGLVGSELCRLLLERGHTVVAQSRSLRRAHTRLPNACELLEWNPLREDFPLDVMQRIDAVVNLIGESVAANRWSRLKRRRILQSRLASTRRLAKAIKTANPRPLVFLSASAVGYYGDGGDRIISESSPAGKGFLADICIRWEAASEEVLSVGVRRILLRMGVVVSGRGGAFVPLITLLRLGLGAVLGSGQQWLPWIHQRDAAGLMVHLLEVEGAAGVVNGVTPQPVTHHDLLHALGNACHRWVWMRIPAFLVRLAAGDAAALVLQSQRVVSERIPRSFEWTYPELEDALNEAVSAHINL